MASKDNLTDGQLGAFGAPPYTGAYYALNITTTSANIASLPKGRYIVRLSQVDLVAIGTSAQTEATSGSSAVGGVFASGDQLNWRADGVCHVVVLNSGTGRIYLTPAP